MSSSSNCIVGGGASVMGAYALHNTQSTQQLEQAATIALPPHTLMQRAGLALAQLTLAAAPHAKTIWIACGPGNNGGDGFEAAMHLKRWGKNAVVSCHSESAAIPLDAALSRQRAVAAGVELTHTAPDRFDVCIDALFGIGKLRPLQGLYAEWIERMNTCKVPVIAVDLPTGLHADTGHAENLHVKASHTLSLLTLKPGLFTAFGRDACGEIWFNDLGVKATEPATAYTNPTPRPSERRHNSHKGSYGDVLVVGGDVGMEGAALLAATAALHAGAGRVFVAGVGDSAPLGVDTTQPELMFRPFHTLDLSQMVVVAGCGGGTAMARHMESVLQHAARLVLDADGLNVLARDSHLQTLLKNRSKGSTVLTPHPLEAARLLHKSTSEVQANRLAAAQRIADQLNCCVVLKGSGSIIAAPEQTPRINTTGNANLATAGTGDVLAGLTGSLLATHTNAFEAACAAVYQHGIHADQWHANSARPLTALRLAKVL